MNCPRCGKIVGPNNTFCENCGYNLTNNIPNSTPINNQNIGYQQSINNNTNNTMNNNFNNTNMNVNMNTNVNNVPPEQNIIQNNEKKKFNPLFVIILIILIVVVIICYFIFFNKKEPSNNGMEENIVSGDNSYWDSYTLYIDGKKIALPMKYSEFEKLGFRLMNPDDEKLLTGLCPPRNCGGTYNRNPKNPGGLFTNGKTENIVISFYNTSKKDEMRKDCYVYAIYLMVDDSEGSVMKNPKIGEVKIVNNTRKVTAIMNKTKREYLESRFGKHHVDDDETKLRYYPDHNHDEVVDIYDMMSSESINMSFDKNTGVLIPNDFAFYNRTGLYEIYDK